MNWFREHILDFNFLDVVLSKTYTIPTWDLLIKEMSVKIRELADMDNKSISSILCIFVRLNM